MSTVDFWLSDGGISLLKSLARSGVTHEELADRMGISKRTLMRWMVKHKSLLDVILKSKQVIDAQVEDAILKKALGFETTEIKCVKKPSGDEEITEVTKTVPPDISACSMWLKNSCPEKWASDKDGSSSKVDEIIARLDSDAEKEEE